MKDYSVALFQEGWLTREEFKSCPRKVEKSHKNCFVLFAVKVGDHRP